MKNNISTRIEILIVFIIAFCISFYLQDYIFKYKVHKVIEKNPNITLQEFMGGLDE